MGSTWAHAACRASTATVASRSAASSVSTVVIATTYSVSMHPVSPTSGDAGPCICGAYDGSAMVVGPQFPVAQEPDPELEGSGHSAESLVEEGMLIVRAALRLAAKNQLILRALRDEQPYDRDELAAQIRAEMHDLAAEKRADAARLKKAAARAARRRGRAAHQTDYRR